MEKMNRLECMDILSRILIMIGKIESILRLKFYC
jgi:hypothetical protein